MFNLHVAKINVLVLYGIHESDLLTDFIKEDKLADVIAHKIYSDIPTKFTNVDTWPKSSNLKCWNCSQIPIGPPCFIPFNVEMLHTKELVCRPHGNFDTWNCAVRFVMHEYSQNERWDLLQGIILFESLFTGKRRENIPEAPSKTIMQEYCGHNGVSINEYNNQIKSLNS